MQLDQQKLELIFHAAQELGDPDERESYLRNACEGDLLLKAQVEALLKSAVAAEAVFGQEAEADSPPGNTRVDPSGIEGPGTWIGRYKLLQEIGQGGMGVVYMAEQQEPMKRRVALKIIKQGMDTKQVIARFEAERQALALMDHPNIAKVLDAGLTDSGRPYFAMELVKGIPVNRFCDEHHLTMEQRLKLFIPICQAVQHAHQKGIIHRDLKPSNVLVVEYDHQMMPKIIDFGVAKALNQSLTERTMFTRFGEIIGTLDYMSPEQAKFNQLDIDTRSDIYSLGVLLYELLTGDTPIEKQRLQTSALEEVLRIIREEEPPRPSTRLGSSDKLPALASRRKVEPQRLSKLLRGDLDWIVMKALAKERSERYQTAEALAADIERHLQDQPIQARHPSRIGQVRRLVRRNKVAVTFATLVLLATGLAVSFAVSAHLGRLKQQEQALLIEQRNAQEQRENWARHSAMPAVRQLRDDGHLVRAFLLAKEILTVLPHDPALQALWSNLTVTVSFDLNPPGTQVFVRDWNGRDDDWLKVGETPLINVTLPKGTLRFRYVKEGYLTREFEELSESMKERRPILMKKDFGVPEDMVFVERVQAEDWNNLSYDLGDYLIDRYEVSNREFQAFVDAGGYEEPRFWDQLQFARKGKTVSWTEAMEEFKDASGRAGPAGWRNGQFPAGEAGYPVRGVSWFEAAAYARFAGKSLPTIHHWQWPAETSGRMVALSNFSGRGPAPRGTYKGIGRYDVYDLAGNVKEWCWNADMEGRRCLRGGAWNEASYRYLFMDVASPWERSETHGFRCVRYLSDGDPPPKTLEPWRQALPHLAGRERLPLAMIKPWYEYDKDQPINPTIIKADDGTAAEYRHEIVRIDAAYNQERFDIHLYFPHEKRDQYETIVLVPGMGAWLSERYGPDEGILEAKLIPPLVKTCRAVCVPVCKGTWERGDGKFSFTDFTVKRRDLFFANLKDVARTVEYLRTRDDVDANRLLLLGYSLGATYSVTGLAFNNASRFHAAILVAGGYPPAELPPPLDVVDPYHFTPHVRLPVLLITGGLDTVAPYQSHQLPFFEDLGSTNKHHAILECGHNPPTERVVETADQWLRALFGPP